MAKNEVFRGLEAGAINLPLNVGTGIVAGDPVRVGAFNGVAQTDAHPNTNTIETSLTDGYAQVWCFGTFNLPVTFTNPGVAGDPVYATVDGANKLATLTDTNTGKVFGILAAGISSGAGTAAVTIVPVTV